jgi:3-oxoacyl-(acyl-carrier-protein) synthase
MPSSSASRHRRIPTRSPSPIPTGHSYGKAIENALKDAKLSPRDVDLLVPHGVGIESSDRAELNGLRQALGDDLSRVATRRSRRRSACSAPVAAPTPRRPSSPSTSGKIPPGLNTRKPRDGQKLNVSPETREAKLNVAVSSVSSLGGQNAALVFRRA